MGNANPAVILYLNRCQVNGLLHVFESYISLNINDRMIEYAEKMKKKIYDYGKLYCKEDDAYLTLKLFETDCAIIIKLMSTFVDAVFDNNRNFYFDIIKYQSKKTINHSTDDYACDFDDDDLLADI